MGKLMVLFVLVVANCLEGRYIHPRSIMHEKRSEALLAEIDGIPIELIRQMRPARLVPVNNEFFFKSYPDPCDDGFKRDFLGVCREVWD